MDRFGKWALRVVFTIMAVLVVNTLWQLYAEASAADVQATVNALGRVMLAGSLFGVLLSLIILAVLMYTRRNAPPLDPKTRKEIHDATEE